LTSYRDKDGLPNVAEESKRDGFALRDNKKVLHNIKTAGKDARRSTDI